MYVLAGRPAFALPNPTNNNNNNNSTLGEKETYKYLGILEADIMKHADMKEKN